MSLELQADSLPDEVPGKTQVLLLQCYTVLCMTGQTILLFFIFFFFKLIIYYSIVDLQWYVSFSI